MIESKIYNLVSIAIFLLYNKMLSGQKKLKMVLVMKFQDKMKSKRCDYAMQKFYIKFYLKNYIIMELMALH